MLRDFSRGYIRFRILGMRDEKKKRTVEKEVEFGRKREEGKDRRNVVANLGG